MADAAASVPAWRRYFNELIASEISSFSRYYDRVIQWKPLPHDTGFLLEKIDCPGKERLDDGAQMPDLSAERPRRTIILINGTFNYHDDIQGLLADLKPRISRTTRVVAVVYNSYLSWLYRLADALGIGHWAQPTTFITLNDLGNIARLSGFELVRFRPVAYCPWKLLGIGSLINAVLPSLPLLRWMGLSSIAILRPVLPETFRKPSLTIVIPARNERGNIESALTRMPAICPEMEVVFVEGHSKDGTWEEIERVAAAYKGPLKVSAFRQTGAGKNDAVRLGFSKATGEVLTILDADLTMPPELLGRFYDAYVMGRADFINGTRLVYPMEGEAMRFLNLLANVFFAKALSSILDARLGDSLCGTKLMSRHDYLRMTAWHEDFGDFDPFGDFELIFPAAVLGLGIIDVPIRYRARTYGSTNISRFRHGLMLLNMTLIGFFRIRLGKVA